MVSTEDSDQLGYRRRNTQPVKAKLNKYLLRSNDPCPTFLADRHPTLLSCIVDTTFGANINYFRLGITRRSSVYYHHHHQRCLRVNEKSDGTYLVWEVIYPSSFLRRSLENVYWHSVSQHRGGHECLQMMLVINLFFRVDLMLCSCCDHVRWVRWYMSDTHIFAKSVPPTPQRFECAWSNYVSTDIGLRANYLFRSTVPYILAMCQMAHWRSFMQGLA